MTSVKKSITVKSSFIAFHYWADAPAEVSFLSYPHRHVFNVFLELEVTHSERQLEFFMVQKDLKDYLEKAYGGKTFGDSCERLAEFISVWAMYAYNVNVAKTVVQEDDENFATVEVQRC